MKFIAVNTLETDEGGYEPVHINIDHIVTITDYWVEKKVKWKDGSGNTGYENTELPVAKILLSNGSEIICDESVEMIEKEFKEFFKQY
jgi:hypothetical protein